MTLIDNIDITQYITKNGITDNPNVIIDSQYETSQGVQIVLPKGFHNVYSLNLSNVPESIMLQLESLSSKDSVSCNVDGYEFNGSIDNFNSVIDVVYWDFSIYTVKMTISDNSLNKEEGDGE